MRRICRRGMLGALGGVALFLAGCIVPVHRPHFLWPRLHRTKVIHTHGHGCGHVLVRGRWVVIDRHGHEHRHRHGHKHRH